MEQYQLIDKWNDIDEMIAGMWKQRWDQCNIGRVINKTVAIDEMIACNKMISGWLM